MTATEPVVRASGGLVLRTRDAGSELLLVHRPRYDDWSFPKGKQDPGETDEETALREVAEETGIECTLGPELGRAEYRDHRNRPKVVRYWVMHPAAEASTRAFTPNDEVDELRWCEPDEAATLLTYHHDRVLLQQLARLGELE